MPKYFVRVPFTYYEEFEIEADDEGAARDLLECDETRPEPQDTNLDGEYDWWEAAFEEI